MEGMSRCALVSSKPLNSADGTVPSPQEASCRHREAMGDASSLLSVLTTHMLRVIDGLAMVWRELWIATASIANSLQMSLKTQFLIMFFEGDFILGFPLLKFGSSLSPYLRTQAIS